jgi:hypothetical protein
MAKQIRIGWVGGMTRIEQRIEAEAAQLGYELEFHDGNVTGKRARTLRSLVQRCDVVVVSTDRNSHRGALTAKEEARLAGKPLVMMRACGLARLGDVLNEVTLAVSARTSRAA